MGSCGLNTDGLLGCLICSAEESSSSPFSPAPSRLKEERVSKVSAFPFEFPQIILMLKATHWNRFISVFCIFPIFPPSRKNALLQTSQMRPDHHKVRVNLIQKAVKRWSTLDSLLNRRTWSEANFQPSTQKTGLLQRILNTRPIYSFYQQLHWTLSEKKLPKREQDQQLSLPHPCGKNDSKAK